MFPLRAVIFDWGGVLMRTEDYSYRQAWDQSLGQPYGYVEKIVHGIPEWAETQLGHLPVESYWQAVKQKLSLSAIDLQRLHADFYRGDQLDSALVDLICDLRANHIKTGLLSNNSDELKNDLNRLDLHSLFDAVVISSKIGVMKPSRESYKAILHQLVVSPQNSLFVDDSSVNIRGAQLAGLQTVLFSPGTDLRRVILSRFPQLSL